MHKCKINGIEENHVFITLMANGDYVCECRKKTITKEDMLKITKEEIICQKK